jgi:subtilisin family serine protease
MERGWGSPASYIECFEWFLAPTKVDGTEPDPSKAPHVIANSWSCPEQEGCVPENFDLMRTAIENHRAAGVMVVTSAGNSGGQGCESVSTPPSIFAAAFAVGATNIEDTITGFSSRGPATLSGDTILQPQVVAPGANIRSSIRNNGYANFSGTSMSGPHTAGAVALLISALPELAGNVDGLERIFRESATPLFSSQDCGDYPGDQHPNAVYGYGLINLAAAYELGQELVSTEENEVISAIQIFPNPTQGAINISVPANLQVTAYEVLDFTGAKLISSSNARLDLAQLPTGIYLVRVVTNAGTVVRKVVKGK